MARCNDGLKRLLDKAAEQKDDIFITALIHLAPISVTDITGNEVICQVWVAGDFEVDQTYQDAVKLEKAVTAPASPERFKQIQRQPVHVTLAGKKLTGYVEHRDIGELYNRRFIACCEVAYLNDSRTIDSVTIGPNREAISTFRYAPWVKHPAFFFAEVFFFCVSVVLAILFSFGFKYFNSSTARRLRENIFDEFVQAENQDPGIIHTIGKQKWALDPNTREFMRVSYEGGEAGFLTKLASRNDRCIAELSEKEKRDQRRWISLAAVLVVLVVCALLIPDVAGPGVIMITYLPGYYLVRYGFWTLPKEWAYQRGWQNLSGAMVIDPEPARAGREDVERQKAHGDARIATEDEAIAAAASGAARKSTVHDQEF